VQRGGDGFNNLVQPGLRRRGLAALQSTPLASWDTFTVCPPDGRGWVEVESPQAFAVWAFITSQNGVQRVEYRRTGPATRDGVYVERGCVVKVYVVDCMRDPPLSLDVLAVYPQNGRRVAVDPATRDPVDPRPRCVARFWPGSMPPALLRPQVYGVTLNNAELQNSGAFTVGYATGYNRWFSGTFGRSITWQVADNDVAPSGGAFMLSVTADQISAPVHPWAYVQVVVGGGPIRDGLVTFSTYPTGNSRY
jgi:hypothetical protein